jgi:hypothetical protein
MSKSVYLYTTKNVQIYQKLYGKVIHFQQQSTEIYVIIWIIFLGAALNQNENGT